MNYFSGIFLVQERYSGTSNTVILYDYSIYFCCYWFHKNVYHHNQNFTNLKYQEFIVTLGY